MFMGLCLQIEWCTDNTSLSQLHLQESGLHADINGDGVLDHVQVIIFVLFVHEIEFKNDNLIPFLLSGNFS